MLLAQLRIANFRGIGEASLDLDPTTVLIGENNVGKTSLLAALERCLGLGVEGEEFAFAAGDFGRDAEGGSDPRPIEIDLRFRERETGEWRAPEFEPLRPTMTRRGRRGEIHLRVVAECRGAEIAAAWSFLDRRGKALEAPGCLAALRKLSPFVLVDVDRRARADSPRPVARRDDAVGQALERRIDAVYRVVVHARRSPDPGELADGLAAVQEWLGRRELTGLSATEQHRLVRDLVETPVDISLAGNGGFQGSGLRSIGLLLVVGALLEARGPLHVASEAQPILAIEEPEGHLHPLLLDSVWGLIAGLRAQKLVTTNSPELLGAVPLGSMRRLSRDAANVRIDALREQTLDLEEMRRVSYHVRMRRGGALFARCWLLVEGETEFWLFPELARLAGCDLAADGVDLVEFAQCGPEPLVKLANDLGIPWHLFVDGDRPGKTYAASVRAHLGEALEEDRITVLREPDMEHCLWRNGYAEVYRRAAGKRGSDSKRDGQRGSHSKGKHRRRSQDSPGRHGRRGERPGRTIERAVRARSKPRLALDVVLEAQRKASPGVPGPIQRAVEACVRLARAHT